MPVTASGGRETLLVTATIAPRAGVHLLARVDPESRRREYLAAFEAYARLLTDRPDFRLVLVENSGADLSDFRALADRLEVGDRVEFVGYTADDPPQFNRLFLELALIRRGLAESRVLADPSARIWKITGRYRIARLDRFVARAPERFDIYLNLRDYPAKALDFYVAGFSARGLDAVATRLGDRLRIERTGEDVLRNAIEDGEFDDLTVVPRFRAVPWITGTRGHDGRKYHGAVQALKYAARVAAQAVAPRLWI